MMWLASCLSLISDTVIDNVYVSDSGRRLLAAHKHNDLTVFICHLHCGVRLQAPVGAPPDVASRLARCFDELEKIELMLETLEDMEQQVCGVIQASLKKSKAIYILQQERRQLRSQVGKLQQENARLRQQLARMAARQQVLQAQQGGADAAE